MIKASLTTFFYLSLLAQPALAEFPTSCRAQELQKDQIASVVKRRSSTFKHCLVCEGQSCQLKNWPASGSEFAKMCKILFCTPKRIPRTAINPEDADQGGSYRFTYTIGKNGRIQDIRITEVSGEITPKIALKLANASYKRRKYEPIVVDGTPYELSNLIDSMRFKVRLEVR